MRENELFILAEQTFGDVVQQIQPEHLMLPLPEWFELGRSQDRSKLTLRDILNYHTYDFAKLIGIDRALPVVLVEGAYAMIAPHADEWRKMGIYKPARPVAKVADVQAKLVGRDPNW